MNDSIAKVRNRIVFGVYGLQIWELDGILGASMFLLFLCPFVASHPCSSSLGKNIFNESGCWRSFLRNGKTEQLSIASKTSTANYHRGMKLTPFSRMSTYVSGIASCDAINQMHHFLDNQGIPENPINQRTGNRPEREGEFQCAK